MDDTCRDYFGSAENMSISRKRALEELKKHHFDNTDDIAEFYADVGDCDIYRAQDVLRWLGY
ncbi:hypothetical protein EKL85_21515 [Salmonella enterica subsp. enterica serovar Give]|nr:hypothetical protein [Salmonella enterica subsp. enterica serovar Give]ECA4141860.1 hypothetical protein [Salmonella enterica subsp. enterica serovar Give]